MEKQLASLPFIFKSHLLDTLETGQRALGARGPEPVRRMQPKCRKNSRNARSYLILS